MTTRLSTRVSIASILTLLVCGTTLFAQPRGRKEPALYQGPGISQPSPANRAMPPSRSLSLPRPALHSLGGLSAAERAKIGAVGMKQRIGVHRTIADGLL